MNNIYEPGTFTPQEILDTLSTSILDESLETQNDQGLNIFNRAIAYLNNRGFKFPYLIAPTSDTKNPNFDFQLNKPYYPIPNSLLMGFIAMYCGYVLARVNEDDEIAGSLSGTPDGWIAEYSLFRRDSYLINPQYISKTNNLNNSYASLIGKNNG